MLDETNTKILQSMQKDFLEAPNAIPTEVRFHPSLQGRSYDA